MTSKEATERRKMMARAWAIKNPDGTPKLTSLEIAKMFGVSPGAMQMTAVNHREMFPYRCRGCDTIDRRLEA